jgi:hypothetical protein
MSGSMVLALPQKWLCFQSFILRCRLLINPACPMCALEMRPVQQPADLELFLDVPARVYQGDPHWVAPLRSSIARQLSPENPFRTYGTLQAFVALNPEPVGRIVATVNQRLVDKEGEAIGLFGYFETINDSAVSEALFAAAIDWLKQQGMTKVRGPIDLSTHNNCLMLVDGFDSPPMVMMPYNLPHYPQLVEQAGFTKAKDAYAYEYPLDRPLPSEFEKAYKIAVKSGVTFRSINTKGEAFERDAVILYRLFTEAFANNWSSTPRTEEEFVEEARSLQQLVDPDVVLIAEVGEKAVGFFMGLPDYNIPLKQVNGKLDLWGTLKFLWYRRQIDRGRVVAICALPEYQRKLVPLALIYLGLLACQKKGKPYRTSELGWVYEDNLRSRRLIEAAGGTIYKTYRIYEKAI